MFSCEIVLTVDEKPKKEMQFFELLQIAIGNRKMLSHTPTAEEWREICALAKKQAMVGIAFRGVELLPVEQRPPRKLWMQWYTAAERIKGLNAEMDRKVFKVARMFRREGFQGVVLKGQGMAQLYKVERSTVNSQQSTDGLFNQRDKHANLDTITHTQACAGQDSRRLNDNVNDNHDGIYTTSPLQGTPPNLGGEINCPDGTVDCRPLTVDNCSLTVDNCSEAKECIGRYRTPGDIDIWLHGEREAILEYVRWHVPDCKPVYHHVDFPVVDDVSIEVHFTPTWMNSPIRNRRLQRFFKSMVNSQQSTDGPHPNPLQGERGLGHPDEGFDLTQKAQNNCQGQGQQTTVNGQRTDHPDEGFDLTQKAQKAQRARCFARAAVRMGPLTVDR